MLDGRVLAPEPVALVAAVDAGRRDVAVGCSAAVHVAFAEVASACSSVASLGSPACWQSARRSAPGCHLAVTRGDHHAAVAAAVAAVVAVAVDAVVGETCVAASFAVDGAEEDAGYLQLEGQDTKC